jgi:hypothetical protein
MSNTDDPESFIEFICKTPEERIIIAFSVADPMAQSLLQTLAAKYHLRCFVLHHRWSNPADVVSTAEMALLAGFAVPGGVYDYTPPQNPAAVRAADFLAYMQAETPF